MASRPPAGLSAADFFASWLPSTFAAAGRTGLADAPVVRVTLSGRDGGDWLVRAGEDGLEVKPLAPGPRDRIAADIHLRQATRDFAAAFSADPDLPELLPAGWSVLDLLFLDPRDVDMARQISGRVALEVEGRRRRRWTIDLAFGKAGMAAGRPRATIRIDAATYDGLRTRTIAPMQALLGGGIRVDGDRALASQLLLLTAARLARQAAPGRDPGAGRRP